ncbi:MAG: hypothetical protein J5534_13645 [Fibrobacter sp.]|nr:hypothetical protein [Fibrobacter sp.]
MHILKTCLLSVFLLAMFLCGCSQTNEEDVQKAKRFEALKGLPLDTVLTRAYKFYEQFQATGDTLQRDSMNDYRDHFFARWKRSTDSLCATIPADDSLAADLREINEAVSKYFFEYHIKHMYWFMLDTAKRESLLGKVDSTQKVELTAPGWRWDTREEDEATIMGIPFEEALSVLKKDSTSVFKVVYFIQTLQVHYVDTVAADMNALLKIDPFGIKQSERKEAKSACMEKTPIGQQVLVLNKEYESLLNNFMKTKAHGDRRFLMWEIPVSPRFWEDDFSFHSYPTIVSAVFNKNHDMVTLNVNDGYGRGGFYYLSKRSGKWEVVRCRDGWIT